jgi:hypothetical protein
MTPIGARHRPARARAAAVILVTAPITIAAVLVLGGGQVRQCLGWSATCSLPVPEPTPIIGSPPGLLTTVAMLAFVWFGVAGLASRYLWSTDRRCLVRSMVAAAGIAVATALIVAIERAAEDQGRRAMAEDAVLFAVGALIVAVPLILAWAVLTTRTPSVRLD